MKILLVALALFFPLCALVAENKTTQTPITMEQLMRELHVQGGNFTFEFDTPVYARVTTMVTSFPDGKKTEWNFFDTASANQKIDLFFQASPHVLGGETNPDRANNYRVMKIRLSDCQETENIRVLQYIDKWAYKLYHEGGMEGMWRPSIPPVPQLNKPYVLHWYYRVGDPYQAGATITFSATPFKK